MIIGILGFIGSGKGTLSTELVRNHGFVQDSFAASVKDICATVFGWPRHLLEGDTVESREWREEVDIWWANKLDIVNFSPRYALQFVGTDVFRKVLHEDIWMLTLQNRLLKNSGADVVISDVRFKNEVKFLQDNNGILVRVRRGADPVWYSTAALANEGNQLAETAMRGVYSEVHQSEWGWAGCNADYTIENNGSLADLQHNIETLLNAINRK